MKSQVLTSLKLEKLELGFFILKYTFTTYSQIWHLHLTMLYVREKLHKMHGNLLEDWQFSIQKIRLGGRTAWI